MPQADERMTLDEIIRASTYGGAYANFMEEDNGSIEVGKTADLIAFPADLHQLDVEDISEITPVLTIFDGRIVFDANEK